MKINSRIALSVEGKFDFSNPGLLRSEFAKARCCSEDEILKEFAVLGTNSLDVSNKVWNSVQELKRLILKGHGYNDIDELAKYGCLLIRTENCQYFLNDSLPRAIFERKFKRIDSCDMLLYYIGDAGESCVQHGISGCCFMFRSREKGSHNRPHIHVEYRNTEHVFSLDKPIEMLEPKNKRKCLLRGKKLREVVAVIDKHRAILLQEWQSQTDGIVLDIDSLISQ